MKPAQRAMLNRLAQINGMLPLSEANDDQLVQCKQCNAWINLDFGKEAPAAHLDATGTKDDPRSPGDHNDICDQCDYGTNMAEGHLVEDELPKPKRANHIDNLTNKLKGSTDAIAAVRDSISQFKSFLGSSKFTGTEDGERKDWISTGDVLRWLNDLDSSLQ